MRFILFFGALVALVYWLTPSIPPTPDAQGRARVVDGDTLWIGDAKIRLFGIDAPEAADPLGPMATTWLRQRVAGQVVSCSQVDRDRYGRMVAVCKIGHQDISQEITRIGLARAYRRYSLDYVDEEESARAAGLGVWAGVRVGAQPVRAECAIKGNISQRGRIYHLPGSHSYNETIIDPSKGERWFCTESQAQDAGWRAPRN